MEKIWITVVNGKEQVRIETQKGGNLAEALHKHGIALPVLCNHNGTCGKCRIRLLSGRLPVSESDKSRLTDEEIKLGIRLACKALCHEDIRIEIVEKEEEDIVVENISPMGKSGCEKVLLYKETERMSSKNSIGEKNEGKERKENEEKYFIAADIGTTTIAMALVKEKTGEVCDTYTSLNHQRNYGADVISRIQAANQGKGAELKRKVEEDLWKGIQWLVSSKQQKNLSKVIVAGNTAMIHLLMGYSCETLGKAPFHSDCLSQYKGRLKDGISISEKTSLGEVPFRILPGISAFVGADVVADLVVCPAFQTEEISLLIDLGTNGEMVLGNREKKIATSVAAGPAFEGGNISCGTAGIPGAISRVKIQHYRAVIKTIQEILPPVGICGTGLISAVAQLKEQNLIDHTGRLNPLFAKTGFPLWKGKDGEKIALYQSDIREFQMAKAAVRAGIETLTEEYGCRKQEIKTVYLAGGFGRELAVRDAVETGILPMEFLEKTKIIGNGAIQGAVAWGNHKGENMENILNCRIRNIALAEREGFRDKYIKYLDFFD